MSKPAIAKTLLLEVRRVLSNTVKNLKENRLKTIKIFWLKIRLGK